MGGAERRRVEEAGAVLAAYLAAAGEEKLARKLSRALRKLRDAPAAAETPEAEKATEKAAAASEAKSAGAAGGNASSGDGVPEASPREKRPRNRFERIDAEKAEKLLASLPDERLKDQSFRSKKGGDAFAAKAAADLGRVRGKDFRKEMQKKKRATWTGTGRIDMGVNSIEFPDSD